MGDYVIKSLERDRKKAIKAYGEAKVFSCLSEDTEYQILCETYSELQKDLSKNCHTDEAKWLKSVIEKTIFSKVMSKHGYSPIGIKLDSIT